MELGGGGPCWAWALLGVEPTCRGGVEEEEPAAICAHVPEGFDMLTLSH